MFVISRRYRGGVIASCAVLAVALAGPLPATPANAAGTVTTVKVTGKAGVAARSITATCPAGSVAVGATLTVPGAPYGVHLTGIWPAGRKVRVDVEVLPDVPSLNPWIPTVVGLCIARPAGLTYVTGALTTARRDSDDDRRYGVLSEAVCPDGKELVGMGARATGGYLSTLLPLGMGAPYTNDDAPVMHGVRALGRSLADSVSDAAVQSQAVCANLGNGSMFGSAENVDTSAVRVVTASCPRGTQMHSAGWVVLYPNHYADGSAFSYATVSRVDSVNAALTSERIVARRHRDSVATERWGLVAEPLCGR